MITKIKRQTAIEIFPNLPLRYRSSKDEDFDCYFPKTCSSYVLTAESRTYRGHISTMATEITSLVTNLGNKELIFLCDLDTPWLHRGHDYRYAREAQGYLSKNDIGKRFNGALQVSTDDLATFLKQLCWLIRCNAVLPYVYFTDPEKI